MPANKPAAATVALWLLALPPAATATDIPGYLDSFSCSSGPFRLQLPASTTGLRQLAPIQAERVVTTRNWGEFSATVREIRFRGMTVNYLTFTSDPAAFLPISVTVYGPQWSITGPFHSGDLMQPVRRQLGRALLQEQNSFALGGDSDKLRIEARRGRISEIEYQCQAE